MESSEPPPPPAEEGLPPQPDVALALNSAPTLDGEAEETRPFSEAPPSKASGSSADTLAGPSAPPAIPNGPPGLKPPLTASLPPPESTSALSPMGETSVSEQKPAELGAPSQEHPSVDAPVRVSMNAAKVPPPGPPGASQQQVPRPPAHVPPASAGPGGLFSGPRHPKLPPFAGGPSKKLPPPGASDAPRFGAHPPHGSQPPQPFPSAGPPQPRPSVANDGSRGPTSGSASSPSVGPRPPPHNNASPPGQPPHSTPGQVRGRNMQVGPPSHQVQKVLGAPPPPTIASGALGGGGMRELRVEDALVYLDDVKREFGDRPRIYNEFLEIMKNFKSQEVDTPGVINRVSKLFRGYNNLILGFNKFLPEGFKISLEDLERQDAEYARQQQQQQLEAQRQASGGFPHYRHGPPPGSSPPGHAMNQQQGQTRDGQPVMPGQVGSMPPQGFQKRPPQGSHPPGGPPMARPGPKAQGPPPGQQHPPGAPQQQMHGRAPPSNPPQTMQAVQRGPPQQPQQQHQAVEFDHAISYVTNIKKRFADDPSTYHQFLEILHTYQKEQRGIKEVLEQVATLFAEHPDLLKEFTFFLPDAVQEQAKERLHRAAADSEARQALAAQQREQGNFAARPSWGGPRGLDHRQAPPGRRMSSQKFIDMTGSQQMETSDVDQVQVQRQVASARKRPFSPGRESLSPEAYVYTSAVERQFFEAAKEALISYSRDGGQAWAEFVKCLDMYAQELLSKNEMLSFVEPLLGKRNTELFAEFKRILNAAGSPTGPALFLEDSWHSVPLSEIDFFRCRQCTPSYRALPRDYPAPPCSARSDEEKLVLNDIWVSLPKGSEESYTFRHMRRNHCEEVLFRCEDERFEIDMAIDSNAATLRRLEPIAEEIEQLAQKEPLVSELTIGNRSQNGEGGMGGLRYQYTFDPSILGVIHRNSIARIYGDAGQEMLDLIVKNPSVAVPVVVQRLRQKDQEWKAARDRLNRHWKELVEMNYYKSLDHRSLTWRTVDKRATSTRTLIAEIKDRAANGGKEGHAAITARIDKAKEEHGTFYEVTMGEANDDLDITNLPKPYASLFTPHMSFLYENNNWAQLDAYRILSFALERGSTSPADKERCHRLWKDFFGPFFGIPLSWMQKPAISYQESTPAAAEAEHTPVVVSNGEENSQFDDEDSEDEEFGNNVVTEELRESKGSTDKSALMDHHPLPAGVIVSTVYGEGRVVRFRRSDRFYEVQLAFGKGFLRPNTVLCTVQRTVQSPYTNQLRREDKTRLERSDDLLCFGTQSLYLFFRLHQILIRRLNIAKRLAYDVNNDVTLTTLVEQMKAEPNEDIGRKRYDAFLSLVYGLVDSGAGDAGGKYEDRVRCLLGHGGYELATMDKLISHLLKNLQSIAHDDVMMNLVSLFRRHYEEGFRPEAFKLEAAYLSEGDNMFAFELCQVPGSHDEVLYMEFLGVIYEDDEPSQAVVEPENDSNRAAKRPRVK